MLLYRWINPAKLPDCNEPFVDDVDKVAEFSLHAGAQASSQLNSIPRRVRPEQRALCTGDAGQARQRYASLND
jgi:hypothetical protein